MVSHYFGKQGVEGLSVTWTLVWNERKECVKTVETEWPFIENFHCWHADPISTLCLSPARSIFGSNSPFFANNLFANIYWYAAVRRPSTMHQPCLITKCWCYVVFEFVSWQPNFASWGCRGNISAHICQIPFSLEKTDYGKQAGCITSSWLLTFNWWDQMRVPSIVSTWSWW